MNAEASHAPVVASNRLQFFGDATAPRRGDADLESRRTKIVLLRNVVITSPSAGPIVRALSDDVKFCSARCLGVTDNRMVASTRALRPIGVHKRTWYVCELKLFVFCVDLSTGCN